jgi:hypothetical protein
MSAIELRKRHKAMLRQALAPPGAVPAIQINNQTDPAARAA